MITQATAKAFNQCYYTQYSFDLFSENWIFFKGFSLVRLINKMKKKGILTKSD